MWPLFSILCLVERVALNFHFSPYGGCGPYLLSSALRSKGGLFSILYLRVEGGGPYFFILCLGEQGGSPSIFSLGGGGGWLLFLYLGEGVALIFYPVYIYIDRAKFISAVLFNTVNLLGFYSNLSSRTHALPNVLHVETTGSPSNPVYLVSTQLAKCCSQCL